MVFSFLRRLASRSDVGTRPVAGGRIPLVGFPPTFSETSFVQRRRQSFEAVEPALATPMHETSVNGRAAMAGGGVYDARGRRIEAARREISHGVPPMRVRRKLRPHLLAATEVPDGDVLVYAGPAFAHFGHFLLEGLSRLWWTDRVAAPAKVRLVFHETPPRGRRDAFLAKSYVTESLRLLGLAPERAVFVADTPLRFDRLMVPSPTLSLGGHAYPGFATAYERIAAAARGGGAPKPAGAVYFSRTGIRDERQRVDNEAEIEALMRELGVEVVRPETLPFAEQIRLVGDRRLVVGCAGSAMHLVAFAGPETRVLCLDTWHNTNQLIIEHAKGLTARHLWFGSKRTHVRRENDPPRSVDLDAVRSHTLAMLAA